MWKLYTIVKVLFITGWVELVRKKSYLAIILNQYDKIFIIYTVLIISSNSVYTFYRTQITVLKADETFIAIYFKCTDFVDIFSPVLIMKLIEYTRINNYVIELINSKQTFYELIHNLELVMLETLKTYIKTNLVNKVI